MKHTGAIASIILFALGAIFLATGIVTLSSGVSTFQSWALIVTVAVPALATGAVVMRLDRMNR